MYLKILIPRGPVDPKICRGHFLNIRTNKSGHLIPELSTMNPNAVAADDLINDVAYWDRRGGRVYNTIPDGAGPGFELTCGSCGNKKNGTLYDIHQRCDRPGCDGLLHKLDGRDN